MLPLEVIPLSGPQPSLRWEWELETSILSGICDPVGAGMGRSLSVQLNGVDGSLLMLDLTDGVLSGIDVIIAPELEIRPTLTPPAKVEIASVAASAAASSVKQPVTDYDLEIQAEANPAESTWHLKLGGESVVATVQIADLMLVELDQSGRLAGLWLLQVPPITGHA